MRTTVILAAFLAACSGGEEISAYGDQVLDKGRASVDEMERTRKDVAGTLSVDGQAHDWTLTVSTGTSSVQVDLYSPGRSDLSVLDGREVLLSLVEEPLSGEVGLSITEPDGSLLYLMEPVEPTEASANAVGTGFAQLGADLGPQTVDRVTLNLASIDFADDAGTVEALPGEPVVLELDGRTYRAVNIAAYDLELDPDAPSPNCRSAETLLSYEVVLAEEPDLSVLTRPSNASIAVGGCDTL